MSMTSESDERIVLNNCLDSPSTDDANSGGSNVGNNGPLKKGPWTSAEDAILIEYVTKHGEGNWNAVQKHSGLARCGKSCRLRWANHLRPDLKKGAFTPEEEHRIIELHAKMGNKWAKMAAELPGRTDNEIKNFWNTRIKRRQRAGLPIYPPDICFPASNNNPQTDDMNTLSPDSAPHPDFMPVDNFIKIPSVEFKGLELDHQFYPQTLIDPAGTNFLDLPSSGLFSRNFNNSSYHNRTFLPTSHQSKRLRGSESLFQNPVGNAFAVNGSQLYQNDCSVQISKSYAFSQYDHHPNSTPNYFLHTTPNVYELPSLQTQTGNGGSPSSPLPFFESVDILIQTPPTEHGSSSSRLSPQNSGLLEEVLYESETLKNSNGNVFGQLSRSSNMGNDEEVSPLGHSPSSVFSESNPITPVSGNSFDDPLSDENLPVKEVASNLDPMQYEDKFKMTNQMIFSRPDYLLASNCLGSMKSPTTNDHSLLENAMGKFLDDDLSRDCKQMDMGPSSSGQAREHNSCAWNAMRTA